METQDTGAATVSVIIPAFNVAPCIRDALESVFEQSYRDYEIILVDDGSTDDLDAAIAPFRDRIVFIRQENRGPSAARNAAIRVARSRYLATLDGDDVWMPDYLHTLVGRLEAEPELDVIYPNAVYFGATRLAGRFYQDIHPSSVPVTYEKILTRECNVFGSPVFKREIANEVGGYDEALRACEDFDLWLRMAAHGASFDFTTEPLVRVRKRRGSLSNNQVLFNQSLMRVYEKVLEGSPGTSRELVEPQTKRVRARLALALAKQTIAGRDFRAAAQHLAEANSYYRRPKLVLAAAMLRIAPSMLVRLVEFRQARWIHSGPDRWQRKHESRSALPRVSE